MTTYQEFLASKAIRHVADGIDVSNDDLSDGLFDWQRDIVRWALGLGRAAIFADCGLGKTFMQLEWARHIPGRVLILAPLAVANQTVREGSKFGIDVAYLRDDDNVSSIVVTNYEMLDHFDPGSFEGVVLDESSILKAYDGKTRTRIIEAFDRTPYRLACTATPAPNDYMELGNHSAFLGAMSRSEMLATFFVHDMANTQDWRLKGHAIDDFWKWLSSWAVMVRKPSDLGYDDDGFILPPIHLEQTTVDSKTPEGMLFPVEARGLMDRRAARKASLQDRVAACAEIVAKEPAESWLIWCNLNSESELLAAAIPGSVEVRGSMSVEDKEFALRGFLDGSVRVLISKPTICGFGMNFQHCARVAFVGLSDSWEQYYQATRRVWRFGQSREVWIHIIISKAEGAVLANVMEKETKAAEMAEGIIGHTRAYLAEALRGPGTQRRKDEYAMDMKTGTNWKMYLGDCVEIVGALDSGSVDYSVFSPPFASLYTYSASDRDMGNCRNYDDFGDHFRFLVKELRRVLKEGRLVSVHCMNLPTLKAFDGYIGIRDFRGDIIRLFEEHGFIYHSEVCIWKDPVTAMQRTKALGLLHKQLKKDSAMSRMGIPDYLCTFRVPGENAERISHSAKEYPVSVWQRVASPIWTDINPSDTLQFRSAREDQDERHICPLQLEVIRRSVELWSNPGDLVLSPFAGIGSEGVVSLRMERRFLGVELKRSYYDQACANLSAAVSQLSLFEVES